MSDIFAVIKRIQKTDRSILPHAEKNLLISIAVHLGNGDHIWPNNTQLGERIGENKDYVKNLLMRLKKKGYITTEGRGKDRKINIVEAKVFGNSQLPNHEFGNSQLPSGNSQLPNEPTPIKRKEKNNIKEKSGAAPDSFDNFHPYIDEIMSAIPRPAKGRLSKIFMNKCLWEKRGDRPYFYWLFDKCYGKNDPASWIAGGLINYYAEYLK